MLTDCPEPSDWPVSLLLSPHCLMGLCSTNISSALMGWNSGEFALMSTSGVSFSSILCVEVMGMGGGVWFSRLTRVELETAVLLSAPLQLPFRRLLFSAFLAT